MKSNFQALALAVVVSGAFWPLVTIADDPTTNIGQGMAESAIEFLSTLGPEEFKKAAHGFDDPSRLDWHNIPKPERKGLVYSKMSEASKLACMRLVRSGLSEVGFLEARRTMALESNLHEGEKGNAGGPIRDPERYYLTIFGMPASKGIWGWSFEGHHLSLNFAIRDGSVISHTPSFWGANPAIVKIFVEGGPPVGTRSLTEEEQLAFDLAVSLDESQRVRAWISETAPAEYRSAGQPTPPQDPPAGIAASMLTPEQNRMLKALVHAYTENWAPTIRDAQLKAIEESGWENVHFAWMGSLKPGIGHAYRVQGPAFILEFVNVQSDPAGNAANHIHSVWRNPSGDFGTAQ
jgi:Protein of unknown function (DUF3500)